MQPILSATFPFFALILCGYLATFRRLVPYTAIPGLNTFVLYFALPCMLYRFGAHTALSLLLAPGVFTLYLVCALLLVSGTVAWARHARIGWNDAAFGALAAAFPNTGFMGVPLLSALMGQAAAGPVIQAIAIDMVITSSLCIALSRLGNAGGHGAMAAARRALRGMLVNPMPWSILLGILASATGFRLPGPLDHAVALLDNAASPVALFTIGAMLARPRMEGEAPVTWRDYVPLALAKLVLHPLLVLGVALGTAASGLPLVNSTELAALLLVAALPSAGNVAMLAERFGAHNGRIARIVLVSTVLAFFSFSAVVAWQT
jgi:malonate transporter and related proteins